jgi:hypothetical protein
VDRGVFGAPTFFVGDEMFWGQDRRISCASAFPIDDGETCTMSDILTHTETGVMTLTLNRPDKKNSITAAMYAAMADALAAPRAAITVRGRRVPGPRDRVSAPAMTSATS